MVSLEVQNRVRAELADVEAAHEVRVLFACESGSRAWGFASLDSDYDVRFVYVHPRDWYLSVDDRRDVIERPLKEELDVSGWDLRKALRLLRKSNPPLLEWLRSPVIYQQDDAFTADLRALAAEFYSPRQCFTHYLHMGYGNWNKYLRDRDEVSLKKYLYVFRPLLACRWIERNQSSVPMLFSELIGPMFDPGEEDVREALADLVRRKQGLDELAMAPKVEVLSRFIEQEIPRLEGLKEREESPGDSRALDRLFRKYVS